MIWSVSGAMESSWILMRSDKDSPKTNKNAGMTKTFIPAFFVQGQPKQVSGCTVPASKVHVEADQIKSADAYNRVDNSGKP